MSPSSILLVFGTAAWYPALLLALALARGGMPQRFFEFRKQLSRFERASLSCATFVWILGIWSSLAYTVLVNRQFLPPPHQVAQVFLGLLTRGDVWVDVATSVARVLIGFFPAALVGTVLGIMAGNFGALYSAIIPPNGFLRYIPPTAFIALMMVWFGLGEMLKASVIAIGVFFFVVQMTMEAVRNVSFDYIEVAHTLGVSRWNILRRVTIPAALPDILQAWRINLSAAWTFLVIAEFLGATTGLGRLINVSFRYNHVPDLFAAILLIGVIGLVTDTIFETVLWSVFKWKRPYVIP